MIPNCRGCEDELILAYELLEEGFNVGLEYMGERKHLICFAFDKKGRRIV